MHWGNYGWGMGFGWFVLIGLSIAIILGIIFLAKRLTERNAGKHRYESPLDILK